MFQPNKQVQDAPSYKNNEGEEPLEFENQMHYDIPLLQKTVSMSYPSNDQPPKIQLSVSSPPFIPDFTELKKYLMTSQQTTQYTQLSTNEHQED